MNHNNNKKSTDEKRTKSPSPPKLAEYFLEIFSREGNRPYLLGDLEEDFGRISRESGVFYAVLWYWYQTLIPVPTFIKNYTFWSCSMFKNYFKVALRNIKRHKVYSFINIAGLALGMACCILILFWIQDELSYDKFHKKVDNIYRIISDSNRNSQNDQFAATPAPISDAFKKDFPEIEYSSMFGRLGSFNLKSGKDNYRETGYAFVDNDFFEIFSFELIEGTPKTVFEQPNSVVLTEKIAKKLFKDENPIGKTLTINSRVDVVVTGILKDIPDNSSLNFSFLSPFQYMKEEFYGKNSPKDWDMFSYGTYLTLVENTSLANINSKIYDYKKKNIDPESNITFSLQPFNQIHLSSQHISDPIAGKGSMSYIYIFSALAGLILLIACMNFINLMTARSAGRAKEVGVRKVVGANKSNIVTQFFSETMILSILAFILSLVIVYFVLPEFNTLARKNISFGIAGNLNILAALVAIVILTGCISGSYPAFFISAFKPISILKGGSYGTKSSYRLRSMMVVSQLALSIILIIGSTMLTEQLEYIRNKDLGYDREHLLSVSMSKSANDRFNTLKSEFSQVPSVINISGSGAPVTWKYTKMSGLVWEGQKEGVDVKFNIDHIGDNYFETTGIKLIEGRGFSKEFSGGTANFVINEEAARQMGLESPVGKSFTIESPGTIVGVVKDFIYDDFNSPIEPIVFINDPSSFRFVHVKIGPDNIQETLASLKNIWEKINPDDAFEYDFVDEKFNYLFRSEEKISTIFHWSAFLGIFISCLGLVSLASYVAEQRKKEIGIRKVLGASTTNVIYIIVNDFIKWTIYANLISWPIAWYAVNKWLEIYAYKTELGLSTFLLSGFFVLAAAILTVSFQALKAANANPINSLKHE